MSIILELEKDEWKNPMLIVETDSEGKIIEAEVWSDVFDHFLKCTDWVKNSQYWREKIREEFENRVLPCRAYTGEESY